jgi:cytochrome b561
LSLLIRPSDSAWINEVPMPHTSTVVSTVSTGPVTGARYSGLAIALHWLLGLALVGSFALGVYMHELPLSPTRLKLFNWHKWAGITILTLSFVRLMWRLTHRPPADLPMPTWQRTAAHATHHALYVLFFAVPLAGWAYSSASGFPVVWFGVVPLPDFVPKNEALAEGFKLAHKVFAFLLGALVIVHVGAALKHHFVDRDRLLSRMGLGRSTPLSN